MHGKLIDCSTIFISLQTNKNNEKRNKQNNGKQSAWIGIEEKNGILYCNL